LYQIPSELKIRSPDFQHLCSGRGAVLVSPNASRSDNSRGVRAISKACNRKSQQKQSRITPQRELASKN